MSHDHSHGTGEVSEKALFWSLLLNVGLSVFEFAAGIIAGSEVRRPLVGVVIGLVSSALITLLVIPAPYK